MYEIDEPGDGNMMGFGSIHTVLQLIPPGNKNASDVNARANRILAPMWQRYSQVAWPSIRPLAAPKCFRTCPSTIGILSLASQFLVCQSTPDDLLHNRRESLRIGDLARVEPKHLFVNVSEQIERLDADLGPVQSVASGETRNFHPVRVNLSIDVALRRD
jgi:hypothetical protein